ncbi:MAG: EamA family transporter [Burkholderiales bacterium]|nr:EamA family transporter [Phycisphaerae bacterium]
MQIELWVWYALAAAACAAALNIFGKIGMEGIDSSLATTVRGSVQGGLLLIFATTMGLWKSLPDVGGKAWLMIVLSGAAGAASWLFGFKALSMAKASQVAPLDKLSVPLTAVLAFLILSERPSGVNWIGIAMIAVGAYLAALKSQS